jgi:RNA polymerase sigma factor (sigma-70 family)
MDSLHVPAPVAADQVQGLCDNALMFRLRAAKTRNDIDLVFGELHSRYRTRVLDWCWRLAKSRDRAEDLAQGVFLRAFRYRHTFRGDATLSTWLYAITRNHCLTSLRKSSVDPGANAGELDRDLRETDAVDPYRQLEEKEKFSAMWKLISARLSPTEARVMRLHYGHELPLASITNELMLSNPSGAKAYIVNAKRKLNAVLLKRGSGGRQNPQHPAIRPRVLPACGVPHTVRRSGPRCHSESAAGESVFPTRGDRAPNTVRRAPNWRPLP